MSNLDRYQKDLGSLIARGRRLGQAMSAECYPDEFAKTLKKLGYNDEKVRQTTKDLPDFRSAYQSWYSEAKAVIRQLLPDRLSDFVRHYEKPKPRKDITYDNYRIEDYLQGLTVNRTFGLEKAKIVGPDAALSQFQQQLAILESVQARFQSTLFDIRQLVQADLLDSELDAAEELAKHKFNRAAGAVAGVVLERHLNQVCENHNIQLAKRAPGISDLNDALKNAGVIDTPQWRSIQYLTDIRNLCDHNRPNDPTPEQVNDLISGARKTTKTLF